MVSTDEKLNNINKKRELDPQCQKKGAQSGNGSLSCPMSGPSQIKSNLTGIETKLLLEVGFMAFREGQTFRD